MLIERVWNGVGDGRGNKEVKTTIYFYVLSLYVYPIRITILNPLCCRYLPFSGNGQNPRSGIQTYPYVTIISSLYTSPILSKVRGGGGGFWDTWYTICNVWKLLWTVKTSLQEVSEKKERMKIAFCRRLALSAGLKVGG